MAAVAAAAYLALWILTATWGVSTVQSRFAEPALDYRRQGGFTILDHDPRRAGELPPPPPWFYAGGVSAYLPFVVGLDSAGELAVGCGNGSRIYYFWFFGVTVQLWERYYW